MVAANQYGPATPGSGPENEAEAKRSPENAVSAGAGFRGCDVTDIRVRSWATGRCNTESRRPTKSQPIVGASAMMMYRDQPKSITG